MSELIRILKHEDFMPKDRRAVLQSGDSSPPLSATAGATIQTIDGPLSYVHSAPTIEIEEERDVNLECMPILSKVGLALVGQLSDSTPLHEVDDVLENIWGVRMRSAMFYRHYDHDTASSLWLDDRTPHPKMLDITPQMAEIDKMRIGEQWAEEQPACAKEWFEQVHRYFLHLRHIKSTEILLDSLQNELECLSTLIRDGDSRAL